MNYVVKVGVGVVIAILTVAAEVMAAAMRAGAKYIYQAVFVNGDWQMALPIS